MMTSTRALLTYPGLSFPSRTGPCQRLGPRTQPAQQLLGISHADAVVNVEHGQPLSAARIARPRGRARLTSDDDARHRSSTSPPTIHTVLKERRHNQHSQPHPHMPLTHDSKITKNDVVRAAVHMPVEDHAANKQRSYISRK